MINSIRSILKNKLFWINVFVSLLVFIVAHSEKFVEIFSNYTYSADRLWLLGYIILGFLTIYSLVVVMVFISLAPLNWWSNKIGFKKHSLYYHYSALMTSPILMLFYLKRHFDIDGAIIIVPVMIYSGIVLRWMFPKWKSLKTWGIWTASVIFSFLTTLWIHLAHILFLALLAKQMITIKGMLF